MVCLAILIINIGLLYLFLLMNGVEAQRAKVTIEEYPYLGSLRYLKKESELAGSGYICAATLIHNRVLITTAKCIKGKKAEDLLGVVGATYAKGITTTSLVLGIAALRCHGLFRLGKFDYNIGLVFTNEDTLPIKGKLGYAPIAMTRIKPFIKCFVIGWGVDTSLLSNRPIAIPNYSVSAKNCFKYTRRLGQFCSYKRKQRKADIDHSDSGTPIICNGRIEGLFIHGTTDIHVFTSTYVFRKWINGAIYLHFKKDPPVMESMLSMASMDGSICFQWLLVLAISIYLVG